MTLYKPFQIQRNQNNFAGYIIYTLLPNMYANLGTLIQEKAFF